MLADRFRPRTLVSQCHEVISNTCRGRTDKKLTSTLVIQIFLSFELADIFLKYGSRLFFKKSFKKINFHPHLQQ